MLVLSLKNGSEALVKLFLDNKMAPKDEYVYEHLKINSGKMIGLMMSYGLNVTDEMYMFIQMKKLAPSSMFVNVSEKVKMEAEFVICKKMAKTRIKKIKNLNDLRNIFRWWTLKDYMRMRNDIEPDEICFQNALMNPDENMMKYVFEKYMYVPSIEDIVKISDLGNRWYVLKRFYLGGLMGGKIRNVERMSVVIGEPVLDI